MRINRSDPPCNQPAYISYEAQRRFATLLHETRDVKNLPDSLLRKANKPLTEQPPQSTPCRSGGSSAQRLYRRLTFVTLCVRGANSNKQLRSPLRTARRHEPFCSVLLGDWAHRGLKIVVKLM
jgi:hypothetical protein